MRLIETIKIENRTPKNLDFHIDRMNYARFKLLGSALKIELKKHLQLPDNLTNDVYKCRITYGFKIRKIEFSPYQSQPVQSLKIVRADDLEYAFKYENRTALQELTEQKGECDDILIIKNGQVTDASYANVVFWDGTDWITPRKPLLEGTQRALLLMKKQIVSREIKVSELQNYESCKIINAMLEFDAPAFPIKNILA